MRKVDRKQFLRLAGAGAAGTAGAGLLGAASGCGMGSPARPHDGPNVLLIVIDELRYDHIGAFGSRDVKTPNIDALARESLRFTNVFPEAMPTVPARRTIMTGQHIFPFRGWDPKKIPGLPISPGWEPITKRTFLEVLRDAGYWTAYVSDNPYLAWSPAFENFRATFDRFSGLGGQVGSRFPASTVSMKTVMRYLPRALRHDKHHVEGLRKYIANIGGTNNEVQTCAARTFTRGGDVLEEANGEKRPFALVVDCFDPHEPWVPPRKYLKQYGADPDGQISAIPRYTTADYLSHHELRSMKAAYAGEVTLADRWLGQLMNRFHDLNRERDTVVALISDHGVFLGDHDLTGKIASRLFPELIHVPFLLRDPAQASAGRASDYRASTQDIGPTLLKMAGVEPPDEMDGTDLSPLLHNRGRAAGTSLPVREMSYGGYANHFFARTDRWSLSLRNNGTDAVLNNLRTDPTQHNNVAAKHPDVVRRLQNRVKRKVGNVPFYEQG